MIARVRRPLGLCQIGEKLHTALIEDPPALGEREPPRRAVEQPCIQMSLELGNLSRYRGHR